MIVAVIEMRNQQGSAQSCTELVAPVGSTLPFKEIASIQFVVAEKLENAAMKLIRARLDGGIEDRAISPSELGAIATGLDFEFLDGIHRRLDDIAGAVLQIGDIRVVVNTVQQIVVLIRAGTVRAEPKGVFVRGSRLGRSDTRGEQRQLAEITAIERQVVDRTIVDDLAEI